MDEPHPSTGNSDLSPRADGAALPSAEAMGALIARLDRPVVLVGLMGVGKSTIGKRLAHCLSAPFIDADDAIALAAQMSIPEIFEKYGEAHFRDGERRVIARLIEESTGRPTVIATGGGAFVDPATRRLILGAAIAVWLDSELDTLVERVSRRQTRPLLVGKDPRAVLAELKAARQPAYAEAPIHVLSDAGPQMATVARILQALEGHL